MLLERSHWASGLSWVENEQVNCPKTVMGTVSGKVMGTAVRFRHLASESGSNWVGLSS